MNARLRLLYALSSVVLAGLALDHALSNAGGPPRLPPVAPAVAAIVAASPRERALATLKAITPGVIQRRFDQETLWHLQSLLKAQGDGRLPHPEPSNDGVNRSAH